MTQFQMIEIACPVIGSSISTDFDVVVPHGATFMEVSKVDHLLVLSVLADITQPNETRHILARTAYQNLPPKTTSYIGRANQDDGVGIVYFWEK